MSGPDLLPATRSCERPTDAGFTLVGVLDDPAPVAIDRGGLVRSADGTWLLDWWIGAEDRWHVPAREPSVRQQRLGSGPVVETRLRVPGGDVVHRCCPVPGPATVVEIENDTPVALVVALTVRRMDLDGNRFAPGPMAIEDDGVYLDGRRVIALSRPAAEAAVGDDDAARPVLHSQAISGPLARDAATTAVIVFPLPHTASLRVLMERPDNAAASLPDATPGVEDVVRSWDRLVDGGGQFASPDNGIDQQAAAARARMMVTDHQLGHELAEVSALGPHLLRALATSGSNSEVEAGLVTLAESFERGSVNLRPERADVLVEMVNAVGLALAIVGEATLADLLLGPLTQTAALAEQVRPERRGEVLAGLAWAALTAGQPDAAGYLWAQLAQSEFEGNSPEGNSAEGNVSASTRWERLARRRVDCGPTGAIGDDDLRAGAALWNAYRSVLLREHAGGVDVLPGFPPEWRGGAIEVHRASTAWGPVSFAIRWHGARPALLWEVHRPGWSGRMTCSTLDAEWSSAEPTGETLLSGSVTPLPVPPASGESFT